MRVFDSFIENEEAAVFGRRLKKTIFRFQNLGFMRVLGGPLLINSMDAGEKVFSASIGVCTIRINKPFLAISSHEKKAENGEIG